MLPLGLACCPSEVTAKNPKVAGRSSLSDAVSASRGLASCLSVPGFLLSTGLLLLAGGHVSSLQAHTPGLGRLLDASQLHF